VNEAGAAAAAASEAATMYRTTIGLCVLATGLALTGCTTCKQQSFAASRPGCNTCASPYVQAQVRLRPTPAPVPIPSPPPRPAPERPPIARLDAPAPIGSQDPLYRQAPDDRPPLPPGGGSLADEPAPDPLAPNDAQPAAPTGPPPPARLGPPRSLSPYERRDVAKAFSYDDPPPTATVPHKKGPGRVGSPEPKVTNPETLLNVKTAVRNVSSGLKPYPDDFAWLAKQGYRSVLHLRDPDRDDVADERLAKRARLKYQSLVAAPERLDRRLYEDFVRAVNGTDDHPLYVYHKDGTVAGGLWYLYFHLHQGESDEVARGRARNLGLDFSDTSDPQIRMVEAVQRLVSELRR
jgi:protein tyrosine phosphatase (PTP) superfamily phosphohydrolase (DUF442 family)